MALLDQFIDSGELGELDGVETEIKCRFRGTIRPSIYS